MPRAAAPRVTSGSMASVMAGFPAGPQSWAARSGVHQATAAIDVAERHGLLHRAGYAAELDVADVAAADAAGFDAHHRIAGARGGLFDVDQADVHGAVEFDSLHGGHLRHAVYTAGAISTGMPLATCVPEGTSSGTSSVR